jgi:hypothetical protein
MFIPDPNLFHPGSRAKKISRSATAAKNLSTVPIFNILTQNIVSKLSET